MAERQQPVRPPRLRLEVRVRRDQPQLRRPPPLLVRAEAVALILGGGGDRRLPRAGEELGRLPVLAQVEEGQAAQRVGARAVGNGAAEAELGRRVEERLDAVARGGLLARVADHVDAKDDHAAPKHLLVFGVHIDRREGDQLPAGTAAAPTAVPTGRPAGRGGGGRRRSVAPTPPAAAVDEVSHGNAERTRHAHHFHNLADGWRRGLRPPLVVAVPPRLVLLILVLPVAAPIAAIATFAGHGAVFIARPPPSEAPSPPSPPAAAAAAATAAASYTVLYSMLLSVRSTSRSLKSHTTGVDRGEPSARGTSGGSRTATERTKQRGGSSTRKRRRLRAGAVGTADGGATASK
ncbi:hypothetical protein BU14_0526s0010 [Porphyra umbilicalis]|uniref:Uncharacterized protein n=1 Tax=Porphyra umbilicalis TaxID=2786 RepID=A0A1X6NS99_PORUM|nr:hypothetical protein BU14_0526s0010 [Porphyra umbilicalis]|eukprot:OSX71509.1 hypothetical protein BU14_0526s0010 [Porphyra umbilicalis]